MPVKEASRVEIHLQPELAVHIMDVLLRLPTPPASRIDERLPHRWIAALCSASS